MAYERVFLDLLLPTYAPGSAWLSGWRSSSCSSLRPADPANYVYGNKVYGNDAGIHAYRSGHAQIYDNVIQNNGRAGTGGWVERKPDTKWLEFTGPAGKGIQIGSINDVKVFNNISYGNRKAGLALYAADGTQVYGNIFFGNDLAQICLQKGEDFSLGFNTIIAVDKQGPPFLVKNTEAFATVDLFHAKFPYLDEGTKVVPAPANQNPLAMAEELLKSEPVSMETWQQSLTRLKAKAVDAGIGRAVEKVAQAAYDPSGGLQLPLPWRVPGAIQFENYDVGGPEVAFHDKDPENQGGYYRKDGVDIKADRSAGNGAVVGFTNAGEWLAYTINVEKAGKYALAITYASPEKDLSLKLTLNDKPLGDVIKLDPSAAWDQPTTSTVGSFSFPEGDAVLRVTIKNGLIDLDQMRFTAGE